MYKEIAELRPYFRSLREIKNQIALDVQLPLTWIDTFEQKEFPNVKIMSQDSDDRIKLVSYISTTDELGYKSVFKYVKQVVLINIERERKEKLLEEKINELKKLFKEKDLNSLENLNFEQLYEHEGEGIRISNSEGHREEELGDSITQEKID